jgi:hypothetical protein
MSDFVVPFYKKTCCNVEFILELTEVIVEFWTCSKSLSDATVAMSSSPGHPFPKQM